MKLSVLIAKLQVVEEVSGDMDVLWRDGFSNLVEIGDLALLHEDIIDGEEHKQSIPILIIKSSTTVRHETARAQAA